MPSITELTSKERLAASRQALVRYMSGDSPDRDADDLSPAAPRGAWTLVKHTMQACWRNNHPAGVALDLARPVVAQYAKKQTFKLLGISASIGAAAVLLRPWRLVSLGAVLVAAFKSSELSNAVLSMLPSPLQDSKKPFTSP